MGVIQKFTGGDKKLPDIPDKIIGLRLGLVGASILGLYVFSQIIWAAVSAAFGLAAFVAIGALGVAGWRALPLLTQKLENRLLAAQKAEARENPIEQLQNFLLAKTNQKNAFKKGMTIIGGQIKTMEDMLADRKKNKPGYDATKLQNSIDQMKSFYDARILKLNAAETALTQVQELIEDRKFEWEFAKVGSQAMASLNASDGQSLLDNILADEASNSIRENFNQVFADLEIESQSLNSKKTLEFAGQTIDVSAISIPELQPAVKG